MALLKLAIIAMAFHMSTAGVCEPLVDPTPNSSCYDKDLRPKFGAVPMDADVIDFGIHVYQIGPVSESTMSMSSDLYVRMYWTDKRLTAMANKLSVNASGDDTILVKGAYADAIWRPNIYFVDSMSETTPSEVSQSEVTLLKTNGQVLCSTRILLKTRCPLDLSMFPMDTQVCPICFSSYMYNDAEQLIRWLPGTVDMREDLSHTATFDIDPELKWGSKVKEWGEGEKRVTYTTLCMNVKFNRKFNIYIVTMFLPSISLVFLSWVSFCIDKNAVPARAGITITTILAQITLITGTANKFPGIADLKVGDVYMIGNFFFVFGALIEFAIVNSSQRRNKKRGAREAKEMQRRTSMTHQQNDYICDLSKLQDEDKLKESANNNEFQFGRGAQRMQRRQSIWQKLEKKEELKKGWDFYALVFFPSMFVMWHVGFAVFCFMNSG